MQVIVREREGEGEREREGGRERKGEREGERERERGREGGGRDGYAQQVHSACELTCVQYHSCSSS